MRIERLGFLALIVILAVMRPAFAEPRKISSCGTGYAISGNENSVSITDPVSKERKIYYIPHSVDGGAVDSAGKYLAIYGMPNKIDRTYPQTRVLSIYRNLRHPILVYRSKVGGGIYEITFTSDGKFAVLDEKAGTFTVNLTGRSEATLMDSDKALSRQVCVSS